MTGENEMRMFNCPPTSGELIALIEKAKQHKMTPQDHYEQRRSWLRGEMGIEHPEWSEEKLDKFVDNALANMGYKLAAPPTSEVAAGEVKLSHHKDVCECGDYRDQHEGGIGRCKMPNDLTHGFEECRAFRLSERAPRPMDDATRRRLFPQWFDDKCPSLIEMIDDLETALLATLTPAAPGGGWNAAIEAAAVWHEQRAKDTPDAFEMELHQASAKTIRALTQPTEAPPDVKTIISDLDWPKNAKGEHIHDPLPLKAAHRERLEKAIQSALTRHTQPDAAAIGEVERPLAKAWTPVSEAHPEPHVRYVVRRIGFIYTATPCYGMHAPWWVPMGINGKELEPVLMLDTDEWTPLDTFRAALRAIGQAGGG